MPLNVGDYLADTMHLTTLQHGVYIRLIMHYWKRRELVGDDRTLAQIAGLSLKLFRRVSGPVLALFTRVETFPPGDSRMRLKHSRLDIEIAHAREVSEARKAAGMQGAGKRWGWQMPSDGDGKSGSKPNGTRARDSYTPHNHKQESPPTPRKRGARGRGGVFGGGGGKEMRNGFAASAAADMQESIDAEAEDARGSGARVVSITGRAHRRIP